jgi:DNA-binding XRE family transcriptional regulator
VERYLSNQLPNNPAISPTTQPAFHTNTNRKHTDTSYSVATQVSIRTAYRLHQWIAYGKHIRYIYMTYDLLKLYRNMRSIRVKKGKTQLELAQLIGVSRQAIGEYEQSKRYPEGLTMVWLLMILLDWQQSLLVMDDKYEDM